MNRQTCPRRKHPRLVLGISKCGCHLFYKESPSGCHLVQKASKSEGSKRDVLKFCMLTQTLVHPLCRGWCPKFATGLYIIIGIVRKVFEWSTCYFAKRTAWSLIYFLNYAYFEIWLSVLFFSSPSRTKVR